MALALYRRYRPDTFAGVIGQEQVTVPLMRALDEHKLTHAYLFSGPRGCGKTSSARILARCVNCAEGPTSQPCGVCESCRDLATGGPGSIDVVEIDAQVTDLDEYSGRSWLSDNQAAPLLEDTVDLDRYDHVFCVVSLNELDTKWLGLTGAPFENGTGQTCINLRNRDYCLNVLRSTEKEFPESMYVHEFLHFMNQLSVKWGKEYGLHDIRLNFYKPDDDNGEACYTDIILNRARGDAGTGVAPAAWRYPPRILRTTSELTVPSGVTSIGPYAFQNLANLTKVTIPGSVSEIGKYSFQNCTGLTEVTILSGVAGIGEWAFGCYGDLQGSLVKVFIPASVTSIEYAAFWKSGVKEVYYGGTEEQWKAIRMGEFNNALTSAAIHFNSPEPQQPAGARYDHRCAASLTD